MSKSHAKIHAELDDLLNELVYDFIEHSKVPAHLATISQLLIWSRLQAQKPDHPNHNHID
jgi:hypothetical protein